MSSPKLRVLYTHRAQMNLIGIQLQGLNTQGETEALAQQRTLFGAIDLLSRNPFMGKARHEMACLRSFVSIPCVIFSIVDRDEFTIQTIMHHRMDTSRVLE